MRRIAKVLLALVTLIVIILFILVAWRATVDRDHVINVKGCPRASDSTMISTTIGALYRGRCIRIPDSYVFSPPNNGNIMDGIILAAVWPSMRGYLGEGGEPGRHLLPGESAVLILVRSALKAPPLEKTFRTLQALTETYDNIGEYYGLDRWINKSKKEPEDELFVKYSNGVLETFISCHTVTAHWVNPQCQQFKIVDGVQMEINFSRSELGNWLRVDEAVIDLFRKLTSS